MSHAGDVAEAVELLDEYGPPGWREKVDVEILDMDDERRCVLGQLYDDYSTGHNELQEYASWRALLAFESSSHQEAWEEVLSPS